MLTPWGQSDNETKIADGITFVSTPSHGGFFLSEERHNKVPLPLRNLFNKGPFYEEDCEWAAVAWTFPDEFVNIQGGFETAAEAKAAATLVLEQYYNEQLQAAERLW